MTDTWHDSRQRTCWHTDHVCECGGRVATNGTDLWCVQCKARFRRAVPCEVYSRIVGYLRPVQNWNEGKVQEFEERQTYSWAKAQEAINGC